MKGFVLIFCSLFHLATVQAASFNCAKANTTIEQMVCANPEISELDSELAEAYQLGANHASDKSEFNRDQKHWLKSARDACKDNTCLRMVYIARLNALQKESVPEQDGKDTEDTQFFAVSCEQTRGVLSVEGLDSMPSKVIEGGPCSDIHSQP